MSDDEITGRVISAEFLAVEDEDGREPGTYITIRIPDGTPVCAGDVSIRYIEPDSQH